MLMIQPHRVFKCIFLNIIARVFIEDYIEDIIIFGSDYQKNEK